MSCDHCGNAYGKLVVATGNRGKVKEIRALLSEVDVRILTLADIPGAPEVVEDGVTFEENALKKAREVAESTGLLSLADDSGLEVDALGGAPGVYSARYSGEGATDEKNLRLLLDNMTTVPEQGRTARFKCVVAIAGPSGLSFTFDGTCEGMIGYEPKGDNGFGYDPVFMPEGQGGLSFAELPQDVKNGMSHRGKALRAALPQLRTLLGISDSPDQRK